MPRPIIASQAATDILKISDLIEVAGSRHSLARWCVEGVEYEWTRGERHIAVRRGLHLELIRLDEPTKRAAKRAVFHDVRPS
ncbi:hypothetical protein [Pseudomonas sp. B392_1p]|uniref:hypothetical protein n=1 Tax=Pseudomonas sp. B392_1p TaxID=3457507 RepID=UPI003FD606E6